MYWKFKHKRYGRRYKRKRYGRRYKCTHFTEDDVNELSGLSSTGYLRQNGSAQMPIYKNIRESKEFSFFRVPHHVS